MASEELHIIGILNEKSASGTIKVEELRYTYCKAYIDSDRALMCDYIQIAPYHPVLLEVLGQQGIVLAENAKIDIQHIIKAVETAYFNRNIPSFYGNRITKYSIKLLKAAVITYTRGLLTMNEIRDAATVHQMKEFETLSIGVPCTPQTLQSMLWVIKKTINNTLLEKWVDVHAKFLAQPGMLMVDEFIYLLCNCVDKAEMYQRIPKIAMNPTMDKSIKLFQIDKDFGKTYETPDHKIQHMMNTWFNIDKASIEGVASPVKGKTTLKSSKSQAHKNEENQDEESKFRKQLRSMVMTTGIKIKLKEYHQKLIRSRLNGKAAYDRLASQGEVTLPNPLDLQSQLKIEIGSPMNAQKAIMNRPLTAQNKLASPTFSQKLNVLSPNTKSPNTSHINFSSEIFQKMSPFANKRPSSGSVLKFNSRTISPNASFKLVHGRKTSQPNMSGNFLGHKDQDVIPMYEKIIGEEYQLFESQMMPEKLDKRNKSATYFNSSLSTTMTRIYSAKPSKPHLPASPLAEKICSGL